MRNTLLAFSSLFVPSLFAANTVTPSPVAYDADLFSKDRETVFLEGELLVFKLLEGDLEYVSKMKQSTSSEYVGAQGDFAKVRYDFLPGFRITAGYYNAPKYWEVLTTYMWYENHGEKTSHVSDVPNTYLEPVGFTGFILTAPDFIYKARANVDYHLSLLDLLVDRVFNPNAHLRMRILGGLTTVWMRQHFGVRYFQNNTNFQAKSNYDWGYWGVGFRLGYGVDWYWGKDFYFTGRMSAALTIGRYKNNTRTNYEQAAGVWASATHAHYTDYRGAYNFQFILGPSWQKSFPTKRFELFLGYEINTWFNVAEIWRYNAVSPYQSIDRDVNDSALTLNGVNLRLTVDF